MRMKPIIIMAAASLLIPGAAYAQAPASPATPPAQTAPPAATPPANCAPMAPHGSGTGATTKEGATVGQSNETLGDKLAKSDGTLCPPTGVDPEIRAPTPEGGNMPVIPPPGSPGGDPGLRPK
jgi:hypothetical protein